MYFLFSIGQPVSLLAEKIPSGVQVLGNLQIHYILNPEWFILVLATTLGIPKSKMKLNNYNYFIFTLFRIRTYSLFTDVDLA